MSVALLVSAIGLYLTSFYRNSSPDFGATSDSFDGRSEKSASLPLNGSLHRPKENGSEKVRQDRVAELVAELISGMDVATQQEFRLHPDGSLSSAPTKRVLMLDELLRLDPKAALLQASNVLANFKSPDEWAVALRICALSDRSPTGRVFLEERLRALLQHAPWQERPTAGYLEAFDVAVYIGGTGLMPVLTDLVERKNNSPISKAAYLAIDRLVIAEPAAVLSYLGEHPDQMQGRELARANYFARADMSDENQKKIAESYLLAPERSERELEAMLSNFPNANFMISHNLLTVSKTLDATEIKRRDRITLDVVNTWLSDPRFSRLYPRLEGVRSKLEQFVGPNPRR